MKPDSKQGPIFIMEECYSDTFVYAFHFQWFIQSESKLAPANLFHPSSILHFGWSLLTNVLLTIFAFNGSYKVKYVNAFPFNGFHGVLKPR